MSEESERMMTLLQELAALKEGHRKEATGNPTSCRKRRKEISKEVKELGGRKETNGRLMV